MNDKRIKITTLTPIIPKHGKISNLSEVEKENNLISLYGYEFKVDSKLVNTMYYDISNNPVLYKIVGPVFAGKFAILANRRYIIFDTIEEMRYRVKDDRLYSFQTIDLSQINRYTIRFKDYEPRVASLPFNGRYFYLDGSFLKSYLNTLLPVNKVNLSGNFGEIYVKASSIKIYKKLNVQLSNNRNQVQTTEDVYTYEMGLEEGSVLNINVEDNYFKHLLKNKQLINDNSRAILLHTKKFIAYIRDISLYQHSIAMSKLQRVKLDQETFDDSSKIKRLSRVKDKSYLTVRLTSTIIDNINKLLDYNLKDNQALLFAGLYLPEFAKHKMIDERLINTIEKISTQTTIESLSLDDCEKLIGTIEKVVNINSMFQDVDRLQVIEGKIPGIILMEMGETDV